MQIQIKGSYITSHDENVVLQVELDENPAISKAIGKLADELVSFGVPKRTAYGASDDMRDAITRDAIAGLVSIR